MESLLAILFTITTAQKIQTYQKNVNSIRHLPYTEITYRPERGANDERLFSEHPKYEKFEEKISIKNQTPAAKYQERLKKERITYLEKNFPDEYQIHKKVTHIGEKQLERAQQYFYPKNKVIIHHSAMPMANIKNKTQEKLHIQEIQELHTFYRDRGDVGYHFLIGKFGDIYEGRAGGPGIIGAHAQFNNFNSIGINILGNFQNEEPTTEQIQSLIKLLISLQKYYQLDLDQQVLYHAKDENPPYIEDFYDIPISYHKKVGQTACPGENIEKHMPFIKNIIKLYSQHFGPWEDHSKIINKLFQVIAMDAPPEKIKRAMQDLQKNSIPQNPQAPQGRKYYPLIIQNRNSHICLPDTEGKETIKKYNNFLQNIAQQNQISKDERGYFIKVFNHHLYYEKNFLTNPTDTNRKLFLLYLQKLLLTIKGR